MLRSNIKTILFDLDGTLLDTAPDLADALNQLLVRHGKAPLAYETARLQASNGAAGLLNIGFGITKTHPDFIRLRREFMTQYQDNISKKTTLFPGMEDVLAKLDEFNILWGVVTNKPHKLALKLLSELNLLDRCACLIGGGITKKTKPDPEPLLYACELLNMPTKYCVYVGDAEIDVQAAKAIEMPVIAALYGYSDPLTAESWMADYYIDKPLDIMDWLIRK